MFKSFRSLEKQLKVLLLLSFVVLFCIAFTYVISTYFENKIESDWLNISNEKNWSVKEDCLNLFESYQALASNYSSQILKNKKFLSALTSQNSKKAYDILYDLENINDYNIEIYNSRLELFLFSGRQLNPDILELQRALSGEKFSSIKEIGFYTYIVIFEPFIGDTISVNNAVNTGFDGVLVTGKLLDVRYMIRNKYFRNVGISREIYDRFNVNPDFDFREYPNYALGTDSSLLREKSPFEIRNIKGEILGLIYIPNLDKTSYIQKVKGEFLIFLDALVFILNIVAVLIIIRLPAKTKSGFIKGTILGFALILSRYLWLLLGFPSNLFSGSGTDVFSPSFYATGFAFGIARSVGELFITSIVIIIICSFIISLAMKSYRRESSHNKYYSWLIVFICTFIFLLSIHVFGTVMQSLVFDSNLKYFDRSQIISTDQPELIIVQLSILLISISLLIILLSCVLVIQRNLKSYFVSHRSLKKYSLWFVFSGIFIVNVILEFLTFNVIEHSLSFGLRSLIILITSVLTYFIFMRMSALRDYKFATIFNFSIIILACVIFVPFILLNKITSQENKYLELLTKNISSSADDRISFLLMSSLEEISSNTSLESSIKNKNKYPKLAFNIWSESKLYAEDLNTAVFVLDADKKLASDFNINPSELNSDSVINFALRNLTKSFMMKLTDENGSSEEASSESNEDEPEIGEYRGVLQNREMKFYCGIKPIEKANMKYGRYNKVPGYVIIAAQYDARNFLSQSSMQIFRSFTRDNLINKLTSSPVFSEFTDGELAGSSNKDVSKSFVKSLDYFRESVKDKIDKSTLRYDEYEGQLYKSYYQLLNQSEPNSSSQREKIFVVSLKINDFALMTFFVFKFLLFVVVVYLIFLFLYVLYRFLEYFVTSTFRGETFRIGFREKMFASFLGVSLIPIIVLAIYSREYVQDKNSDFYRSQMISDLRIVDQYIKQKFETLEKQNSNLPGKTDRTLSFARIFGKGFTESSKNFNLYVKIKLEASTDEQLYKSDLLDTRISGKAFYNIALLKKDFFDENTDIGSLSVIAGYKPMYDNFNRLIGIISTQTVLKQNEINQELTESLVYIFGVYFIAVIFLTLLVNLLSYRISNPILKLLKATEQLSKGNVEIQVKSSSKDEIGELVKSFNKMTKELKRSRTELKKAERESAWRDIARQVAHEIKNPLTPMKLAMQHLYHSYMHGSNDFKSVLKMTNNLIIDQIETLNKIATEFSDFAKLPSRNYQPLNIDEILQDVVRLFNVEKKINLNQNIAGKKSEVMGDKDEVKRVLINIIRNSIHAIDEKVCNRKNGVITIESTQSNGFFSIKVKDNGIGMDEQTLQQLFEPYFSTKSTGMGLGLVISKKIIDDMKGRIFVRSEINKGTEVEIKFELM